jgi:hypothetical protein
VKLAKGSEILIDVFGTALAAMLGMLLFGKAINSPLAYRLSATRIVGPAVASLRASTNQLYDVTGED